jgi:hypothetical protein
MTVTMTRQQKIAKAKAFTAKQSTKVLVQSLLALLPQIEAATAKAGKTKAIADYDACQPLLMNRSWIIDALEKRYPEASDAVRAAFEAADAAMIAAPTDTDPRQFDVDYEAVLINAIPATER